jgi:hypothetical protein
VVGLFNDRSPLTAKPLLPTYKPFFMDKEPPMYTSLSVSRLAIFAVPIFVFEIETPEISTISRVPLEADKYA